MARRGGRRRRYVVLAVIAVVLVAGSVTAYVLWPRDTARPVAADEALDRFRASESSLPATTAGDSTTSVVVASSPPTVQLPAPGVYRYDTVGTETIDSLGGTQHTYPAETTLTVTTEGCGVHLRWDVLVERREEWSLCVGDDGIELQPAAANYHEFYGVGELQPQVCDQAVLVVPIDGEPRDRLPVSCTMNGTPWNPVFEVVGADTHAVDGVDVPVTHVRMTIVDDDDLFEHTVVEWWLDASGLPVAMSASKQSKSNSDLVGDVLYTEQYRADLVSLTPLT